MLGLRVAFTAVATAFCVWLLATGRPLGGLVIAPALAVWVRRVAESGQLAGYLGRYRAS